MARTALFGHLCSRFCIPVHEVQIQEHLLLSNFRLENEDLIVLISLRDLKYECPIPISLSHAGSSS